MYETAWMPGTASARNTGAAIHFSNVSNANSIDGTNFATLARDGSSNCEDIGFDNFGFSIPANMVITGILVKLVAKTSSELTTFTFDDLSVVLTTNLADEVTNNFSRNTAELRLRTTLDTYYLGTVREPALNPNLAQNIGWGGLTTNNGSTSAAFTRTNVNSSGFGVYVGCFNTSSDTLSIDGCEVKVFYAEDPALGTTAGTTASSGGSTSWANPSRVTASDNSRATMTASGTASNNAYLDVTNFGFSIPSDYEILGVMVEIERLRSGGTTGNIRDDTVKLLLAGSRSGQNKAKTGTNWPTTEASTYYGYSGDCWQLALTPTDINNSGFGVSIRVVNNGASANRVANIDYVSITVWASPPDSPATDQYVTSWRGPMTGDTAARTSSTTNWGTATTSLLHPDYTSVSFTGGNIDNTQFTNYLRGTNFGFQIPSGATILGVEAMITREVGMVVTDKNPYYLDSEVKLTVGGSVTGSNKNNSQIYPAATGSGLNAMLYGGRADLWGATLADTDITASTFGMVLSTGSTTTNSDSFARVDTFDMRVHYEVASSNETIRIDTKTFNYTANDVGGSFPEAIRVDTKAYNYTAVDAVIAEATLVRIDTKTFDYTTIDANINEKFLVDTLEFTQTLVDANLVEVIATQTLAFTYTRIPIQDRIEVDPKAFDYTLNAANVVEVVSVRTKQFDLNMLQGQTIIDGYRDPIILVFTP